MAREAVEATGPVPNLALMASVVLPAAGLAVFVPTVAEVVLVAPVEIAAEPVPIVAGIASAGPVEIAVPVPTAAVGLPAAVA